MKTLLSRRREKFYSLVRQANNQPTEWLVAACHNSMQIPLLSRLACLRILVCRNYGLDDKFIGQPYQAKKRIVRLILGI